ncbi:MAG: hypothetical protein ABSE62_14820 [Chthoniobacteraceae bacterium]
METALEAEAEETGTNPAAVTDIASDINYLEYYLNSPGGSYSTTGFTSAYLSQLAGDSIPLMYYSAVAADSGTLATVFANFVSDASKPALAETLAADDVTGGNKADGNSFFYGAIGPMAAAVAASLSPSDLAHDAPLVAEEAAIPLENSTPVPVPWPPGEPEPVGILPGGPFSYINYYAIVANDVATSSTSLTVATQAAIAGDVAEIGEIGELLMIRLNPTAALSTAQGTAIDTATTVEQTVLTAQGTSQDATVAGTFSSNLVLQELALPPYLGALAAKQAGANIAAVSVATVDGAPKFVYATAYQIALATGTSNAATVAGAIAGASGASSDSVREYVAEYVIAAQPSQDAAVGGAVAPHLSDKDKATLAYLISDQDLGQYTSDTIDGASLNQPSHVGPAAAAIAAQVNPSESTYGTVTSVIAYDACLPFFISKSSTSSTLIQELFPSIADDVATSSTAESLSDQALITDDVAYLTYKEYPATSATTVETVEESAIAESGSSRKVIAATFASNVPYEAVVSASTAAMGQSPELSGSIGAAAAIAGAVPKYGTGGEIAVAVAEAAALPNGEDLNDSLYDTAEAFAAVSSQLGSNTNIYLVANALAGAATGYSATHAPEENDAIPAAIVSAFTSQMGSSSYVATLVELLTYYFPGDAPNILGAVIATLPGNATVTALALKADVIAYAEATNLNDLEALTDTSTKAAAYAAVSGSVTAAYTLATGTEADNPYKDLTPDETPIIDL